MNEINFNWKKEPSRHKQEDTNKRDKRQEALKLEKFHSITNVLQEKKTTVLGVCVTDEAAGDRNEKTREIQICDETGKKIRNKEKLQIYIYMCMSIWKGPILSIFQKIALWIQILPTCVDRHIKLNLET